MIRLSTNNDIKGIVSLWNEAFGDSEAEILFFLKNKFKPENTIVFENNGCIASMLFLLEGKMCIKGVDYPSYYLYAACTSKEYRGRGLMASLLDFAKRTAKERNIYFICLMPAEKSLFDFYGKHGYFSAFNKKVLELNTDEIKNVSPFFIDEKNDKDYNLKIIRDSALKGIDLFKWDDQSIRFAFNHTKIYGGHTLLIDKGYALYTVNNKKITIKEFAFTSYFLLKVAVFLVEKHNAEKIVFMLPTEFETSVGSYEIKESAMMLPINREAEFLMNNITNAYLGLTLD